MSCCSSSRSSFAAAQASQKFGEKAPEKPQKPRKGKTQGDAKGKGNGGSGALYGIPRAVIEAKAQPGENYQDAALRLLEESRGR